VPNIAQIGKGLCHRPPVLGAKPDNGNELESPTTKKNYRRILSVFLGEFFIVNPDTVGTNK